MATRATRWRHGLFLGAAFLGGVALAPVFDLSGRAAAQGNDQAEVWQMLKLFGDVVERVRADYVEAPQARKLVEDALNGMLTGLDAHSSYLNPKAFKDMQVQTRGSFGGLGIEVTEEKGLIRVVTPIDDTPAYRAGVKSGDLITALDGKPVLGLTLNEAVERMRGQPNTKIVLTIKRQNVDKPIEIALIREIIQIKVVKSRMESDGVGYVRLSQFNEQADAGIKAAVQIGRAHV